MLTIIITEINRACDEPLLNSDDRNLLAISHHDITNDSIIIKVSAPTLCTEVLFERDANRRNVMVIQQRLQESISESEHQ